MISKNPLLQPFDTAPFSKIKNEHFKPAFQKCIENAETEIEAIAFSSEKPTFQNTVEALEFSGEQLDRVSSIFFNLNSAETNDEIQQIAQEISPWLTEFRNNLLLNEALFERVKTVFE
ncbi:MAG TPA: M3 family peptidase, partial [Flavobacteriaceae bacterium]|nr:M3 family peptidase [Flavobacteriaceae bacterium]